MSQHAPSPVDPTEGDALLREQVRKAVRRETRAAMERGEKLFEGRWLAPRAYLRARRRRLAARIWQSIEGLFFWGAVLILALGFLVLATLVI